MKFHFLGMLGSKLSTNGGKAHLIECAFDPFKSLQGSTSMKRYTILESRKMAVSSFEFVLRYHSLFCFVLF